MGFILILFFVFKFSKEKRNGLGQESVQCTSTITTAAVPTQRTSKRTKMANPIPAGNAKVRQINNIKFHLSLSLSHTQIHCMYDTNMVNWLYTYMSFFFFVLKI
jgi:hypothetical protein